MLLEMNVALRRGNFDLVSDLSIEDQSIGLLGRSGAGKSTILGLLAGTLVPQSGRIVLDGKILFDSDKGIQVPREQRPIGAVLQHDSLNATETVKTYLSSAYQRTLKPRRGLKLERLIDFLDIGQVLKQPMGRLSTGERQRVLLAKALVKSPKLLLLDDFLATMGQFSYAVTPFLKRLQSELKLPVFYASPALDDMLQFSEQIVVVSQGRVLGLQSLDNLLSDADLLQKLGLRQIENNLRVMICAHDIKNRCTLAKTYGIELVLPLRQELPLGAWMDISISSNDIALSRHYLEGISIQNQIKGQICALIPSQQGILVQVDCGSVLLAGITLKACQDMRLKEGDSVYCLAKTHAFNYKLNVGNTSFSWLLANTLQ